MTQTEDERIIHECLEGNSKKFGLLVDKYKASTYSLAYSKLGNFRDADDITQEAFIQAFNNLRTLKPGEDFCPWLYAITKNLCENVVQSKANTEPS
jgi:RNA polymerase sigma-70 factor (ECF subfamily)